jgi:hypothetical protein
MTRPGSHPRVEALLQSMPREVEPGRDLWPDIESRLEPRSNRRAPAWAWQVAAAVVLVAVSSLVTASLVRRNGVETAQVPATATTAPLVPAAFGQARGLDAGYETARRELAADLERRLASMPPSARQKLEDDLAAMRRAAERINAALARQPGDPLLEELLLSAYQSELGVLASVNQLTSTGVVVAPARQEKLQL